MIDKYFLKPKPQHNPNDKLVYKIPHSAITLSDSILNEYRLQDESHEGLVYWAGTKDKQFIEVKSVVAPSTSSGPRFVETNARSNREYIRFLMSNDLVHIGQVHSHPGPFVDHSEGDDIMIPFKRDGLVSIVVANYGKSGMFPLEECGIHRFSDSEFIRLKPEYIQNHFQISTETNPSFKDLRV